MYTITDDLKSKNTQSKLTLIPKEWAESSVFLNNYETRYSPTILWLYWEDHLKWQYNFFGRIFATVLLVETFNFTWYENNFTRNVTLYNDFSIRFIHFKSFQNIAYTFPGLDVNHSIHKCKCTVILVILHHHMLLNTVSNLIDTHTIWRQWLCYLYME